MPIALDETFFDKEQTAFRDAHEQLGISLPAAHLMDVGTMFFATKGFANTSVRDITSAAATSNPTLYYHFKNKDGLFTAIVELIMNAYVQTISAHYTTDEPLRTQLTHHFMDSATSFVQAHFVFRFMFSVLMGPPEGQPVTPIHTLRDQGDRILQTRFELAITTGELTPYPGLEPAFMVECFNAHHHQWSLKTLNVTDSLRRQATPPLPWLTERLRPDTIQRHLAFFLRGLGHLN